MKFILQNKYLILYDNLKTLEQFLAFRKISIFFINLKKIKLYLKEVLLSFRLFVNFQTKFYKYFYTDMIPANSS